MEIAMGLFALVGVLLSLWGLARLRKRRLIGASLRLLSGGLLLALAALMFSVSMNLHTYYRLTHEQEVAQISFSRLADGDYEALLATPDGRSRLFSIKGDEWQIDARVIKWTGLANLLGMDAQYRLERLSGRHQAIVRARSGPHSVYALGDEQGLDLWSWARRHPRLLPWVDAVFGSAAYQPMADKARYSIHITQSALIARPLNPAAEHAVSEWK